MSATIEERLAKFAPLARIMGREYAQRSAQPDRAEEFGQEALVGAWKQLQAHPDCPDSHVHHVARQAAWLAAYKGVQTGHPGRSRGGARAKHLPPAPTSRPFSIDLFEQTWEETGARLPDAIVTPGFEDQAIASVDVAEALSHLSEQDREHVRLRFWEGLTTQEIADRLGLKPQTVRDYWSKRIAPYLALRLNGAA